MKQESNKDSSAACNVTSIVLAGGQGTRLFPLTESRCKPAVSFGGRYRLIDIPISNSLNSRIRQIFVISQYFATNLNQHIAATYRFDDFHHGLIEMLSPEETPLRKIWFKGTADAVRQNLAHVLKTPSDYFLILSGDQLYNMDFSEMIQFAMQQDADLVIAALPVEEAEAKRMGLLQINEDAKIIHFHEKPSDPTILKRFRVSDELVKRKHIHNPGVPHYLGSMGIYVFKREALISLLKEEGEDFGRHLIPFQVNKANAFAYIFNGYWEDIGTIASYYQANLALTLQKNCLDTYDELHPIYTRPHHLPSPIIKNTMIKNSLISQGSIIEAAEISNSVIGIRSYIQKGSIIRGSILIGNHSYNPDMHPKSSLPAHFNIGENCLIEKAIIDENTSIGNNVHLTNKGGLQKWDGDGIYIRDGIIIVTTGTSLPNGFTL